MTSAARLAAGASVLLAGGAAACAYYATYAVRSQWLGRTYWRGNRTRPLVALTFDDGPSEDTPRILDTLDARGVRGIFFLIGRHVERHPAIARRIAASGHEVGNHSYSHPIFLARTARQAREELGRTQDIIADATGVRPVFARPPCGVRSPAYFSAARALGLRTVQWSVAGFDWTGHPAHRIAGNVLRGARPGAIVLLHDGDSEGRARRRETAAAVPLILEGLRERQLAAVPLAALLDPRTSEHATTERLHA